IGVAWDAGGITTGTVTAPLVLGLGVGMSKALGRSDTGMSGFGIITLCSIWPIALLLAVALFCSLAGMFIAAAPVAALPKGAEEAAGHVNVLALIGQNLFGACASVLPLMALLLVVQKFILKEPVRGIDKVIIGLSFALIGLTLFKIGLVTGLSPLGDQVGGKA